MSATNFLIAIAPLLLLVLALNFRLYPGEAAIGKLRRFAGILRAGEPRGPVPGPCLSDFRPAIRGGSLIASSLAGRGPPFDR